MTFLFNTGANKGKTDASGTVGLDSKGNIVSDFIDRIVLSSVTRGKEARSKISHAFF